MFRTAAVCCFAPPKEYALFDLQRERACGPTLPGSLYEPGPGSVDRPDARETLLPRPHPAS